MTIQAAPSEQAYATDGVSTVFAIPFPFDTAADLKLTTTDASGNILTLSTGFTISGGGGSTGNATFSVAPALGLTITIYDDPARTQPTDYVSLDAFPAESHERALDRVTRITKRLYQLIQRSVRFPDGDVSTDGVLGSVANRKGKYLFFNAVTGAIEYAVNLVTTALSQSIIAQLLNPQTAAEAAASVIPTNYLYPSGHVYRYGNNTTPGTTSMTVAFQNAGLSSLNPYAPGDAVVITGTVPLRAGQTWRLDGTDIRITGTTVVVFSAADGINDWAILGKFSITGDNAADGSNVGTAAGLKIVDSMRFEVQFPIFKNIRGWGILVQPGANTADRAKKGNIIGPICDGCYSGIEVQAGTGAEYISIVSPNVTHCHTGMNTAAGNVNVIGGSVVDNFDGAVIVTGSNAAHGIYTGVSINHNTNFGLTTTQVLSGQSFIGCHFYQNALFFDRSKGIILDGGHIDCTVYNYKDGSSGLNIIRNMYCPGTYGFSRNAGANNGHDQLIIEKCLGAYAPVGDALDATGVSMNDSSWMTVSYKRAVGATQALTSGVAADLLFPTKVYDHRSAYVAGTGIATIPSAPVTQAGWYRVRANTLFGGTAMSATGSFIELKVTGTTLRLALAEIFSTTKLRCVVDEDLYLNAADTVRLTATIVGTTPSFGDGTWESFFTLERLS